MTRPHRHTPAMDRRSPASGTSHTARAGVTPEFCARRLDTAANASRETGCKIGTLPAGTPSHTGPQSAIRSARNQRIAGLRHALLPGLLGPETDAHGPQARLPGCPAR